MVVELATFELVLIVLFIIFFPIFELLELLLQVVITSFHHLFSYEPISPLAYLLAFKLFEYQSFGQLSFQLKSLEPIV